MYPSFPRWHGFHRPRSHRPSQPRHPSLRHRLRCRLCRPSLRLPPPCRLVRPSPRHPLPCPLVHPSPFLPLLRRLVRPSLRLPSLTRRFLVHPCLGHLLRCRPCLPSLHCRGFQCFPRWRRSHHFRRIRCCLDGIRRQRCKACSAIWRRIGTSDVKLS